MRQGRRTGTGAAVYRRAVRAPTGARRDCFHVKSRGHRPAPVHNPGAGLDILQGDKPAIFQAASLAFRAADVVMGRRDAGRGNEPCGS